jgi:hypothetical protein
LDADADFEAETETKTTEELPIGELLTEILLTDTWLVDVLGLTLTGCFVDLFQSTQVCVKPNSFWAFVCASATGLPCVMSSETRLSYCSACFFSWLVPKRFVCAASDVLMSTPFFCSS